MDDQERQPSSTAPGETPAPHDPVHMPAHYMGKTMQAIDVIEAWRAGHHMGNVLKYILRAPNKNGVQDYQKAIWYLRRAHDRQIGPLRTEPVVGPDTSTIVREFDISSNIATAYLCISIAMQMEKDFLGRRKWLEHAIEMIACQIKTESDPTLIKSETKAEVTVTVPPDFTSVSLSSSGGAG